MSIEDKIGDIYPEEDAIPEKFRLKHPIIQAEYLINGELRTWEGEMQEVISPILLKSKAGMKHKVIGKYPMLTEKESLEALETAINTYNNGRGIWPLMSVYERIRHIEKFTELMKDRRKEIVNLLMWEIGKSYQESEKEFDRTIDYIKNTIDAVKDLDRSSSKFVIEQGIIGQIRRAPLGVVLCMGPFNYPLNETFTTLIPALLMGNTVIFKPPKLGVLLHYPLLKALHASFPPGVVNTIYGEGQKVITPVISSGRIDVLAFIGSSRVADLLKKQHPKPHRLRSVLGLEAKNPAIILPDADLDMAIRECVKGSLSFNGQRCTALKIIFVHSGIVDNFIRRFSDAIGRLKCGMPWERDVDITPLPEQGKTEYLTTLLDDAKYHGAEVINKDGGFSNNTFFYPALLYPVNSEMRIYSEEQFGPVVPVVPFEDIETPIRYIMQSSYGQQASIFGNDSDMLAKLVDILVNQVCRVNINSLCQRGPDIFPFAGRKDSGEGTLSVSDALRVFSIRTIVAAKGIEINKAIIRKIVKEKKSKFLCTDFIL